MAMGKHPAICSAVAGLKIKMYGHGCAIWPESCPVPTQCQLCSQPAEHEIMQNYVCTIIQSGPTPFERSPRGLHDQPLNCPIRRSFPFYIRKSG